jgi:hypothetical protein
MSTTTTTPCRVPPPGDATEMARHHYDATPAELCADSLTVGEKVVLDHLRGRPHFGPLCRLCASVPMSSVVAQPVR